MENNKTYDDFFNCFIDLEIKTFNQIVLEWGTSSVALKHWLKTYHPLPEDDPYKEKAGLNANIFLPYRKPNLYFGQVAINRLKLAAKAKVIIIFSNPDLTEEEQLVTYRIECLRLWLRINSIYTKLSFNEFKQLLDDCYNEVVNDWDGEVNKLLDLQEEYKPKYTKIRYHYKVEDFSNVTKIMTLNEAYEDWSTYVYPHLLDYYKDERKREFQVYNIENHVAKEARIKNYQKLVEELNKINLPKPSKLAFRKLLDRFNIEYKKKR